MSSDDYDHSLSTHTVAGPAAALPVMFQGSMPSTLLDVGCGIGTWLRAALDRNDGSIDVCGVDGVDVPARSVLEIPARYFLQRDLEKPFDLGRRFAAALCLEVGEHIAAPSAQTLIASLARHSDVVFFSAAVPGQPGFGHVNCQWPEYWQRMFNRSGYACDDAVRWLLWDDQRVEPWYRQNMFRATRDLARAGTEPRIARVVHPDMLAWPYRPAQ